MRGHHNPFKCMLCSIETKTHDEMIEHFRLEHPDHWPFVRKPTKYEQSVFKK